ncbi:MULTISPECIES: Lrp/AsnC family transcriptional regulator [Nonomuraea]|uniref:Lrp/AsnC family transcriptional regulator n=1 Tax=Nonomuraea TaxID=83681 RepID=UPI001C5D0BC2|nr:Lrp/AsnC family transcriptional regulator [Nonomuraea ceibae]
MDDIDKTLIRLLQDDATQSYAILGKAVGLSAGAAHERVRKLRERGVIRRTTIEVDPEAVGLGVVAYVLVDGATWMGGSADRLAAIAAVEEAHVIAGPASVLLKLRTATTKDLQDALRRVFEVDGVTSTQSIVVLETFFERPIPIA